ncbi:ChrR family anti-sigma-E factor [Henriciella mobilis]|uniref:ChrR-like cupin domain-containing protein n=1 Tax=Henriciella mobilis TaxID=2305467 RepID=A0A399RFN2_9PROT|nr:ChrR family anti-sigma-E factor [Henriciella mobilis]RIJ18074.1 hypothetical protein D1231_01840 [Henriciella mobilis]RIJ25117.1 hypothetical protein D1227_01815 [Henriciella mobilis]RIJ30178.1 hypothetical protein D1223_05880 [Henriciella mobilis]
MSSAEPPYVSELYSAYAAGRLSPAFALMVETQAAIRADIRRDLDLSEAIAGAMLEDEEPTVMSPNAFESALRAIDAIDDGKDRTVRAAKSAGAGLQELLNLPEPLREKALEACEAQGWQRLTGGVQRLDLGSNPSVHAHLYRLDPGASVPRHSHHGDEFSLVLHGGFSDDGASYGPGDIARQTPADTHQPVADDDGPCLVLAVSEGGLKFTGVLGFLQRLAGR